MSLELFILLLCHIIGDFYLQWNKISKCKVGKIDNACKDCTKCRDKTHVNFKLISIHVAVYAIPYLIFFFFVDWYFAILLIALTYITHYAVDIMSCYLKKYWNFSTAILCIDQILHVVSIIVIYYLMTKVFDSHIFSFFLNNAVYFKKGTLVLLLIKPSSILIDCIFKDLFTVEESVKDDTSEIEVLQSSNVIEQRKNHFDVGRIIGSAERLITLVFVALNAYSAIAFVITMKTWARSNEIKTVPGFGNKYLVGTLLSLLIGLVIGYCYTIA